MSTTQRTDRTDRALAVVERLVPLLAEQGVSRGPWATRWVRPPYQAVMNADRIGVWMGRRRLLSAELDAHAGLRVNYFAGDDTWDRTLLTVLEGG